MHYHFVEEICSMDTQNSVFLVSVSVHWRCWTSWGNVAVCYHYWALLRACRGARFREDVSRTVNINGAATTISNHFGNVNLPKVQCHLNFPECLHFLQWSNTGLLRKTKCYRAMYLSRWRRSAQRDICRRPGGSGRNVICVERLRQGTIDWLELSDEFTVLSMVLMAR